MIETRNHFIETCSHVVETHSQVMEMHKHLMDMCNQKPCKVSGVSISWKCVITQM